MAEYAVGVIGVGAAPGGSTETGFAMGYQHAEAYREHHSCRLVACADIVDAHATRFAETYGFTDAQAYTDHRDMLRELDIDILSVATPIPTHASIVIDCVTHGDPVAIHCEKPMASTWGDARLMTQECDRRDVQLTFNHQLRVSEPVERATTLVDDGVIGEVRRVEAARSDLFESGTHQVDMCSHFAGDVPARWVLGAVDYRDEETRYGAHIEDQSLGCWAYVNGVYGLISTGNGEDAIGTRNRVIGTDGAIELSYWGDEPLRVRGAKGSWRGIDCALGSPLERAVRHIIEALEAGTEPLLSARRALNGTEIMFGIYESARRRGRVDLPLTIEDNPLESMVETGALLPH